MYDRHSGNWSLIMGRYGESGLGAAVMSKRAAGVLVHLWGTGTGSANSGNFIVKIHVVEMSFCLCAKMFSRYRYQYPV